MPRKGPGKYIDIKTSELTKKFFENRLFLIIAGSILLIAVAGGITSVFFLRGSTAPEAAVTGNNELSGVVDQELADVAEVLPQQIRVNGDTEERSWSSFNPLVDPFGGPMKLTGVVIGGRSGSMAIIESSGTSYIVSEGDYVDDLWAVRQITIGMVILRAHNQEVSLYFDQPPSIRTLDYERESEEDASEEGV